MTRFFVLLLPVVLLAASGRSARSAADENPAGSGKHWTASVQAETEKKYDDALTELRGYEKAGGDAFLAAERTGWLNYLAGDFAKAEAGYGKAKQLQPAAINPLLGLLNVTQAQKDVRKTERAAEAVLRVEPTNYRAQMALAGLHFAEKAYRKSASAYRRVLTNYPDDVDAMSGAAWAVFYVGEKAEAADIFRKILGVNSAYPLAQRGFDLSTGKIDR